MSTKAIRKALTRLHSTLPATETHLAARALDEVEAIERAAKDITETIELREFALDHASETAETMERITRDAP